MLADGADESPGAAELVASGTQQQEEVHLPACAFVVLRHPATTAYGQ
jgi:hypothetical protein